MKLFQNLTRLKKKLVLQLLLLRSECSKLAFAKARLQRLEVRIKRELSDLETMNRLNESLRVDQLKNRMRSQMRKEELRKLESFYVGFLDLKKVCLKLNELNLIQMEE